MGKTRNAIDSDECNINYEDADVEIEEANEVEKPSEQDPCEDGTVEKNSSEEVEDEADPYEESGEEDPCEEEPSEGSYEEEPDEDSLHAPNSENLCEEEPNESLKEESNEEASCEEELDKDPSCEGPREEECDGEPNEDPQEEHNESEPSEDPEPNEELCEEECDGEPNEDPQEEHSESEPSEDPEPNEELCEEECDEEECDGESNEDPQEEHSESEPLEDPEPYEELCEEECDEEECDGESNEDPQEEHSESEPLEDPEPNEEPYEELCEEDPSKGSSEEERSESEVPSEDDGETIKSNSEQKSMPANCMSVPKGKTGTLGINLLGTSLNMSNNVSVSEKVDITRDRSKTRRSGWDIIGPYGTADGDKVVAKEKRKTRWSSDDRSKTRRSGWDIIGPYGTADGDKVVAKEKRKTRWSSDDWSKTRRSGWDIGPYGTADGDKVVAKEKRKTRWSSDNRQLKKKARLKRPPTVISVEVANLQSQLLQINRKLRAREVVDDRPEYKRSPSPPPVYNNLGIKMNSGEARLRAKLMLQRREIYSELVRKNPNYKPPGGSTKLPFSKKLYIPCHEYPGYKFVGLVMGPRGNTQKRMEKETGAKICLRGRGSVQDGKGPKNQEHPSDNDDLHVLVRADNQFSLDYAVALVEKLLTPVKDWQNEHKLAQLKELAVLNGNLRENRPVNSMKMDPCDVCGDASHSTSCCPLTASVPGANINKHEIKFLAELGGEFSSFSAAPLPKEEKANLFVAQLPQTVDEKKLVELFLPFGQLCQARVIRDRNTNLSRGFGFVKYTDRVDAAKAVKHMNGYTIDGKVLTVRVEGSTAPSHVKTNGGSGGFNQLPQYPGYAAIARNDPDPMCWPGPPGSMLSRPDNVFVKNSNYLPQNPFSGPSTLLSGDVVASDSDELAHFPGYLKSFDPPSQLHQQSPLTDMPSSHVYFTPNYRHP